MIELNEGAYWATTMRVARADTGAATGVLNTGGNFAGIVSAPIIGALSGAGHWNAGFLIGVGFALVGAACWFAIDPGRRMTAPPLRKWLWSAAGIAGMLTALAAGVRAARRVPRPDPGAGTDP